MARRSRRFHFEVPEREVEANEAEEASEIISDEREHACVWYIRSPSSPWVGEMFVRERREQEMFEIDPPNSHRLCLSRPPRARTPALREHVGRGPRCAAVRTPGSASCDERRDGELQQLERQQTVPPGARRSGCKARRARDVARG